MQKSPARHFNLAGASNFRDLGGYPGRDGRAVRWRRIFRSNHLGHLTEADADVLRGLALKSAFNLRGTEERATAVCALEKIEVHSLPIDRPSLPIYGRCSTPARRCHRLRPQMPCAIPTRSYVRENTPNSARCLLTCFRTMPRW